MRRITITGVVALFVLGVPMSASASSGTGRVSCATLASGASSELIAPDGRMFSRASRYGPTFYYGCFNGQPHTRYLASSRYDQLGKRFIAGSLSGGYAAYTTADDLVVVTDLVHGGRIFNEPRPPDGKQVVQGGPSGTLRTAAEEVLVNRYGRVAWLQTVYFHATDGFSHDDETTYATLHDQRGTRQLGFVPQFRDAGSHLSIGIKSVAWRDDFGTHRVVF